MLNIKLADTSIVDVYGDSGYDDLGLDYCSYAFIYSDGAEYRYTGWEDYIELDIDFSSDYSVLSLSQIIEYLFEADKAHPTRAEFEQGLKALGQV